ncbi:MAG: peptide ABC transporter substrate-binding protein [Pyrinomonadaceae bacterium]
MFHKPIIFVRLAFLAVAVVLLVGCEQLKRPKVEPFYSVSVPPPKQELRWSNGKLPKNLDPARAAAAPEADIVRAIYDGLTDLDSRSLNATAAVAEKWEPSDDFRTWTFTLRKDALWSNGERVTADDFVRSWKRLVNMREESANRFLFQNIVGMKKKDESMGEPGDFLHAPATDSGPAAPPVKLESFTSPQSHLNVRNQRETVQPKPQITEQTIAKHPADKTELFGAEAIDDSTLKVSLELPDKDFPRLVAHPIFRPVYGGGSGLEKEKIDPATVTNGTFRIVAIATDGITLEPSETHWNRTSIALESVRFVSAESAEKALNSYEKGDVDVVTNAAFEPLALKLLTPYDDFRKTTHSALNLYEVNTVKAPFSDRRVREALAISIDRTKLTEGELEGTMQPAHAFSPLVEGKKEAIALDVTKAKELLERSGYENGVGFPKIRLVVNRNDTQQRVAKSISKMWLENLNIESEIIVKETADIGAVRESGDFDLIRRGVVLPVNDEIVNLASIFGSAKKPKVESPADRRPGPVLDVPQTQGPAAIEPDALDEQNKESDELPTGISLTMTDADAIFDLRAIPLYFPTSFALVKPYVRGFEMNALDAPSLKEMSIDTSWQLRKGFGGQ